MILNINILNQKGKFDPNPKLFLLELFPNWLLVLGLFSGFPMKGEFCILGS